MIGAPSSVGSRRTDRRGGSAPRGSAHGQGDRIAGRGGGLLAKRPARITDELCELTWDADLEWYEGTRPAPDGGPPYQLAISPDEDEDELDDLLDQARRQVKDLEHRLADLRADAVGEAWELWEDEWRGDRPAMSQAAFAARFQLGFVGIYADQEPELSFRVGDLFHGHDVAVQLDEEGRFEGIDL